MDPEQTARRSALRATYCPTCSAPVQASFAFCGRCGADLAPRADGGLGPQPVAGFVACGAGSTAPSASAGWSAPPPAYPSTQPPGYPPVASGDIGRTLLAQVVLWSGLLLALAPIDNVAYLERAMFRPSFGDGALHLGAQAAPRLLVLLLLVTPYLISAAIVARTGARWALAAVAAVAAAVIQYVFWYSGSHTAWLMQVAIVLLVFAGWIGVRARPAWAYALLAPVAVVATVFYVPKGPGPWLQQVPLRAQWSSSYAWLAWAWLVVFAASGLIGLLTAAVPEGRPDPRLAWAALVPLLAASLIAGTFAQTAFRPQQSQSANQLPLPNQTPGAQGGAPSEPINAPTEPSNLPSEESSPPPSEPDNPPSEPAADTQTYSAPGGLTVQGPAGWQADDSAGIPNIRDYLDPDNPSRTDGDFFRIGIGNATPRGSFAKEAAAAASFLRTQDQATIVSGPTYEDFLGTTSADIEYTFTTSDGTSRQGIERIWRANGATLIIQASGVVDDWPSTQELFNQLTSAAQVS